AVEVDGASPAHAMLAANMRAGEAQILTQEIYQELARLTSSFVGRAIHSQLDCYHRFGHRRAFNGRRERDATRGPSEHESDGGDTRPSPAGRSAARPEPPPALLPFRSRCRIDRPAQESARRK